MTNLVKYPEIDHEMLALLEDALYDTELKFSCADLYSIGIDNSSEVLSAVMRGIQTLNRANALAQRHIKHIFLTDVESGKTCHDWKMSKLGFLLVALSAKGNNPEFNRFKINLIKRIEF